MPDISIVGRHRDVRIGVGERSKNVGIEIGEKISQVNVAAIAYVETDNTAGGKTVTIGTVAPT